jgi:imidazolonepropionase-like amidohydrolase
VVTRWLPLVLAFGAIAADPPPIVPSQTTLVIHPAYALDVRRGVLIEDPMILVENSLIVRVGPAKGFDPPRGATFIELPGMTVMPGLIDAHVHLAWGPAVAGQPIPGTDEAKRTLAAGFTTVRNLGATGKADFTLRSAIDAGRLPGPRMLISGPALGRSKGTCDAVFAGEGQADGVEAVRRKTRELLDAGADVIKLCAGGPVIATVDSANDVEYGEDEIRAIVEEAHARKTKVAAHAHGPAAINNAVRAGVDSIEHGGFIDAATARLMKERGVYLVPTIYRVDYAIERAVQAGTATPEQLVVRRAARTAMRANIAAAIAAGVPIALGTDATVIPHGSNAREIATLVELGMSPAAALRSATIEAAKLLGVDGDSGTLDSGKRADLIAIEGNPLANVARLQSVKWVMLNGKVVSLP